MYTCVYMSLRPCGAEGYTCILCIHMCVSTTDRGAGGSVPDIGNTRYMGLNNMIINNHSFTGQ